MELTRACRNGDVEECRRIWKEDEPTEGELSNLHWLLLSSNSTDKGCLSILELFGTSQINHLANNVALSGLSRIDKVSGITPLHLAVLHKGASVVEKLLKMGSNPNLQDSNGETCLMYASREGSSEMVSILIDAGADMTLWSLIGDSAASLSSSPPIRAVMQLHMNEQLLKMLKRQDNENVASLLRVKADVNYMSCDGVSAMSYAVQQGDYESILRFLECGGHVKDSYLHDTIGSATLSTEEKVELLSELIYMKADVNCQSGCGLTPIDFAAKNQHGWSEISRLLLDSGAVDAAFIDNNDCDHHNSSSFDSNLETTLSEDPSSSQSIQFTQSQAARGGSLFAVPSVDLSELASRAGALIAELEMANRFVRNIGSLGAPTVCLLSEETLRGSQETLTSKLALLEAEFGTLKMVNKSLQDFKAIGHFMELQKCIAETRNELLAVNKRIGAGDFSVSTGSPAESLMGVFPEEKQSGWFRSPDSIEADLETCVRSIRKGTANVVGVEAAIYIFLESGGASFCHSQSTQILKLLRNRGSDVNYQRADGITGLMLICDSAGNDTGELVDFMLTNSAHTTATDNLRGWTPLHFAVSRSNLQTCQKLIKRGAGINVVDKEGKAATEYCRNPAIQKLLIAGPAMSA